MTLKVIVGAVLLANLIWQIHAQVNCTQTTAGRFANPLDTTCQNYTLCVYVATNSSYVSYDYVCPSTSVFNPLTSLCTAPTNYVCNVTTTAASLCTTEGFIADPSVTDCSAYIMCTLDSASGIYTETAITCPAGTVYNPTTTLCETTYTCSVVNCTAAGRFADTTDTTCQRYFMCVLSTDNTYIQYNYTCPTTSLFNPNTKMCTATYTCTN